MRGAQETLQGLYANIVALIIQPVAILKQTNQQAKSTSFLTHISSHKFCRMFSI